MLPERARVSRAVMWSVAVLLLATVGCGGTTVVQGECRPVSGADVCAFSEMAGSNIVAFGATVPLTSIEGVPADAEMVWPPVAAAAIPLSDAVTKATGFTTLTVYWEAHGHPPGPFLTPHFDFHFYALDPAQVDAIDCADVTKPSTVPAGFALPDIEIPGIGNLVGLCVPKMGMHALLQSEIDSPITFEKTMVLGYDKAQPIFIEPMIARATLMAQKSFTLDVPAVSGAPAGVHYPTKFRADYDSTAKSYRFTFSEMAGMK
ncbi:MAG: hypothetical protein OEW77_08155 [Gemmatimonadota bacterium]|nr:hypothetical protein [Gemmatimonadota bacterium]